MAKIIKIEILNWQSYQQKKKEQEIKAKNKWLQQTN